MNFKNNILYALCIIYENVKFQTMFTYKGEIFEMVRYLYKWRTFKLRGK